MGHYRDTHSLLVEFKYYSLESKNMEGNYQRQLLEEYQSICKRQPVKYQSRNVVGRARLVMRELTMPVFTSPLLPKFKARSIAPVFIIKQLLFSRSYNRRVGTSYYNKKNVMEGDQSKHKLIIKAIREIKLGNKLNQRKYIAKQKVFLPKS